MQNLLQTIAKFTIIPLALFIQNTLHPQFTPLAQTVQSSSTLSLGGFNPTGGGTYYLGSSIGSTATSVQLASFLEPGSNIPYTMAYLNSDIEYGTIDPNNSSYTEFISFTGITQNLDGTAMLTGVTRGLSKSYPYTASSTFQFPHSGQAPFILSNTPQFYAEFFSRRSNQTITGSNNFFGTTTFSSTTPPSYDVNPIFANFPTTTLASLGYVNSVAQQGAATATNIVAGITKISVAAANSNNPIAVGDNDPRWTTQSTTVLGTTSTDKIEDYFDSTSSASSTISANKLVRYESNGAISIATTSTSSDATTKSYVDGGTYLVASTPASITSSRTFGVIYQNTTGSKLYLQISATLSITNNTGATARMALLVGTSSPQVEVGEIKNTFNSSLSGAITSFIDAIVPNGQYYTATTTGTVNGGVGIVNWSEQSFY